MVLVYLTKNIDVTFTGRHVDSFVFLVKEYVISVAGDVERRNLLSGFSIENHQFGGISCTDKQAVVCLIQCHGKIRAELSHRPRRDQRLLAAVDYSDVIRVWNIDVDPWARLL